MTLWRSLPVLAALLFAVPAPAAEPGAAVVLGVTLIDSSTEGDVFGVREDETARLRMLEDLLARRFAEEGWRMLDKAPVAPALAQVANPARCNGCDVRLAAELGADVAVTAEVQKVSNLILTINVVVRDAHTGELLNIGNADIRGNTDRSWRRGLDYILKNRTFPGFEALP